MIKSAILTITTASTLTYGAGDAFESIKKSAQTQADIYAAAGQMLSIDYGVSSSAEARMYQAAATLQPLADNIVTGHYDNAVKNALLQSY